jgi:hypothetical protein
MNDQGATVMTWAPLPEDDIRRAITAARDCMSPRQRRLWDAIQIDPEKWSQSPYGDAGGGFWAVGIIGRIVVWYNDIEEGFKRSRYTSRGSILEYTCSEFELGDVVEQLLSLIETGQLTGQVCGAPEAVSLPRAE